MSSPLTTRRTALKRIATQSALATAGGVFFSPLQRPAFAARLPDPQRNAIGRGLKWLAKNQSKIGHWTAQGYPTAMTALAGTAMICSGSTTTQGPYAKNIRRAVDYLMAKSRGNGLIGDPKLDNRYTYGHGFSMLFLSQVLGEEEDADRREEL